MSSQAQIQAKYLFYESVKANKYASWVYKDLEGIVEAQDDIDGGKNPGYYLRRTTEHLVRSIVLLNEWRAATEFGEHEEADIATVTAMIESLRLLTHTSYRTYMRPVMEGYQALKDAEARMAEVATKKREKALQAKANRVKLKVELRDTEGEIKGG